LITASGLTFRRFTAAEVVDLVRSLNDPRQSRGQDFGFVAEATFLRQHAECEFVQPDSAVLALDLPGKPHAGHGSWYQANAALGTVEIRITLYDPADDTVAVRQAAYGALVTELFARRPSLGRVQLLLPPTDEGGRQAADALHGTREGVLTQLGFWDGRWQDLELYAWLRPEPHDA